MDGTAMTNKHFRLFAESFANAALGLCALDKRRLIRSIRAATTSPAPKLPRCIGQRPEAGSFQEGRTAAAHARSYPRGALMRIR